MNKRWRIRPHDVTLIAQIERSAGVPSVLAQLLSARGVHDADRATEFLEAKLSSLRDPQELPGLQRAAHRIQQAIAAGEQIVVYGDYDADGMTAAAILFRSLTLCGANAAYYVPSRMDEGYGLNDDAFHKLAHGKAGLVVSVDCGITSVHEAETARKLGLGLIITDHHQPGERLPNADAIVHPGLPAHLSGGESYPFPYLCGAGVAFKLAWALCQGASQSRRVSEPMRQFLLAALGLAAIGTVADMVPLTDENRTIVKHGLTSLHARPTVGLAGLMEVIGLSDRSCLQAEDIAFALAPRLNAAGRLGQAQLAVELLVTENSERALSLATYINQLNDDRAHLERSIYLAANKQVKHERNLETEAALVLADRDWHQGVIGIVAGRLAEKYHRPVVLISLDKFGAKPATGSARTVAGVNLHEAIGECRELLVQFGGHAAAAGLRIESSQVEAFRQAFCEQVERQLSGDQSEPELTIDAEATFGELTIPAVEQMERLGPFGQGNPRPLLCAAQVTLEGSPRCIGKGDRHLSLMIAQHGIRRRALAFNRADWQERLATIAGPLDVVFQPVINEFRGRRSVELHLKDWRESRRTSRSPA